MKKIFTLAIAALSLVSISSSAQILYKVEAPKSNKVSYILGTHHFAPLSVVDSIAEMPAILSGIDALYGEIDMQKMTDPAEMMKMQQYVVAPADSTIDKVLTADQLAQLSGVWEKYTGGQMPLQMFYPMKPVTLTTQLAAGMAAEVLPDLDPTQQLDMTMQARAAELGKPVKGLESLEYQLDMLYGQPISKQAENLMDLINNIDKEHTNAITLANAYLNHDINKILSVMMEEDGDDAEALDRILYNRNANWLVQLKELMPKESLLVVVGAGHLPGDKGVLKGLQDAGFKVTPVK